MFQIRYIEGKPKTLKMITCHLLGGLGNQLFQIFTTIAYAFQCNQTFGFLNTYYVESCSKRHSYWNSFLFNIKQNTYPSLSSEYEIISENHFHYKELPVNKNENSKKLVGYFQSYKYFDAYFETICGMISLPFLKSQVMTEYSYPIPYDKLISLHFRLGDYKKLPDYHPVLPVEYYIHSLKSIVKNSSDVYNVLYFCEKDDNDDVDLKINKLKEEFPTIEFVKVDDSIVDWKQMLMMSCCKDNIIANSSFSWWAGYFNTNNDKTVCYPGVWFGENLKSHILCDLFPQSWKKIEW